MIFSHISTLNQSLSLASYLRRTSGNRYCESARSHLILEKKQLKVGVVDNNGSWYLAGNVDVVEWLELLQKTKLQPSGKHARVWIALSVEEYLSGVNGILNNHINALDERVLFHLKLESKKSEIGWAEHIQRICAVLREVEDNSRFCGSFELNTISGTRADDVFQACLPSMRTAIYFYPSLAFLNNPGTLGPNKFHALMFFEGQMKVPGLPLAFRLYHKRWAHQMQSVKLDTNAFIGPEEILARYFPDSKEWAASLKGLVKGKLAGIKKGKENVAHSGNSKPAEISDPSQWRKVLITGWYGTETNGDKAILGEVLHFVKSQSPNCKIILTSIYMPVSLQTNEELEDLKGVELISIYEKNLDPIVRDCDAVIMGGGPMMETAEMENIQRIFESGNRLSKARIIFGCGVGPFHGPRYENMTRRCIELCTAGFFRDNESWEYANRLVPGNSLKFACDPAVGFIHRWRTNNLEKFIKAEPALMISLLRANTNEFAQGMRAEQLRLKNQEAAGVLAAIIEPTVQTNGLHLELLHMNTPWVGGDDRLFNRLVEYAMHSKTSVHNVREFFTLEEHLEAMATADLSIAMRYHGHIFSMALGIPFVSIDYTGKKGKVSSLVQRIHYSDYSIIWEDMDSDANKNLLQHVWNQKEELSKQLLEETENLISLLHSTYNEVFQLT